MEAARKDWGRWAPGGAVGRVAEDQGWESGGSRQARAGCWTDRDLNSPTQDVATGTGALAVNQQRQHLTLLTLHDL